MMILAGDIGGTKTNLGLFETVDGALEVKRQASFPSKNFVSLELMIGEFMSGADEKVSHACFGVAGPVVRGQCITPNLPWVVSSRNLGKILGLPDVSVINDLEATAHGVNELSPGELYTLNEGIESEGNAALVAAGTGLGVAGLFRDGTRHVPFASEGGHIDFAPRNQVEIELLRHLQSRYGRVSAERVLSGPGLFNIYRYLRAAGYGDEVPEVAARMEREDPSSVVARAALAGESELCARALDVFASIYGATAGNVALVMKALAGVYIGGGIAPKILDKLKDGTFIGAFMEKGRLAPLMAKIRVQVILNDKAALLGAAAVAARQYASD